MYKIFDILLNVILEEILPISKISVSNGNKIFGAAILNKNDLSIIVIGANNEVLNPINHGEIVTINNFYKSKLSKTIKSTECIFLSTHEPCSLCLSAITWCGFDNFYYFFPYNDTKNSFNIPHDLKILDDVFNITDGEYNKNNSYWKSISILDEVKKLENKEKEILNQKISKINNEYINLSNLYKKMKDNNKIPLN